MATEPPPPQPLSSLSSPPRPRCLVFDFDLTLVDSSRPAAQCIRHALATMGHPDVTFDVARATIGLSLSATYRSLTGDEDAARSKSFRRHFLEHAEKVMVTHSEPFAATAATLDALRARGFVLGIASTKDRHMIVGILERHALHEAFRVIVGGDEVARSKPDPESLRRALDGLACRPQEALYVGDSVVDAETAQRAGVPFAAVLSGTTGADAFARFRPRHVLPGVEGLLQCL